MRLVTLGDWSCSRISIFSTCRRMSFWSRSAGRRRFQVASVLPKALSKATSNARMCSKPHQRPCLYELEYVFNGWLLDLREMSAIYKYDTHPQEPGMYNPADVTGGVTIPSLPYQAHPALYGNRTVLPSIAILLPAAPSLRLLNPNLR